VSATGCGPYRSTEVSLRLRLTALFTIAAALVVVVGGALYLHKLSDGLRDATDASLRSRAVPLRLTATQLTETTAPTAPPSSSDVGGLLTAVFRPDGVAVQQSPALQGTGLLRTADRTRLLQGRTVLDDRMENGISYRILIEPVRKPNGVWTVLVAAPTEETDEAVDSLGHSLIVAGSLVILLAAAGAWVLGSAALRAVDRMRSDVEAITAADITARVKVPAGRDELAALGSTFNALLDRLGFALARQRRFVADAGHELRGPLAVLRMELELADRPSRSREELALAVRAAADEVERLARLADDLLFLARSDDGDLQVRRLLVPLEALLLQATNTRALSAEHRGVALEVVSPPGLRIEVDPDRLRHALDNLLDNALRASRAGGTVRVIAEQVPGGTTITVADTGPGFAEGFLPRAFERFSRPDQARSDDSGGTGLGLAIVQAVAEAHGGTATARNAEVGGAEVILLLPTKV
jgi:two-component system OmpR family sensor kinase